jgi:hypothetical protein
MGRAAAERMASKVVLCRPCRDNNHSECLKRHEGCDCSLRVVLRNTTGFKNVSDDDAHNPG